MSRWKVDVATVQLPLQWWELTLPKNADNNTMVTSMDSWENPTWVEWEIFDDDPSTIDMTRFAQVVQRVDYAVNRLYVLSRTRPTNDDRWRKVGEPVYIPAPWEQVETTIVGGSPIGWRRGL